MDERRTMLSSDSVDGLLFLHGLQTLQYCIGDGPKPSFIYVSLYSLIHYAQCRHSLGLICGDGVRMGSVHGDGWGWDLVSVPVQTSSDIDASVTVRDV